MYVFLCNCRIVHRTVEAVLESEKQNRTEECSKWQLQRGKKVHQRGRRKHEGWGMKRKWRKLFLVQVRRG